MRSEATDLRSRKDLQICAAGHAYFVSYFGYHDFGKIWINLKHGPETQSGHHCPEGGGTGDRQPSGCSPMSHGPPAGMRWQGGGGRCYKAAGAVLHSSGSWMIQSMKNSPFHGHFRNTNNVQLIKYTAKKIEKDRSPPPWGMSCW